MLDIFGLCELLKQTVADNNSCPLSILIAISSPHRTRHTLLSPRAHFVVYGPYLWVGYLKESHASHRVFLIVIYRYCFSFRVTRCCSWLRHCTTRGKVAVSILDSVIGIFHLLNLLKPNDIYIHICRNDIYICRTAALTPDATF